jgi:carbon monoxide dehydrogenase subunit G
MRERTFGAAAGHIALTLLLATTHAAVAHAGDPDFEVKVRVDGDDVHIDGSLFVKATPQQVWAVLTDFEHMPRFISNLVSSAIVARADDVVTVKQSWQAAFGPLSFTSESTREIRMTPYTAIRSRMISGTLKRFQSVTQLLAEDGGTRVTYTSDTVPNQWIPPIVGPHFVEREAREQLVEVRREILRRSAAAVAEDQ